MDDRRHQLVSLAQIGSAAALLLAVIGLGFALTHLFGLIGSADTAAAGSSLSAGGDPAPTGSNRVDLATLPLFGQAQRGLTLPLGSQTKLDLKLRGAIPGAQPDSGLAIIEVGGRQQHYRVGDDIGGASGQVTLHEVHRDHVVLARLGRYETLPLSKPEQSSSSTSRGAAVRPASRLPAINTALANSVKAMPHYENGQQKGFRIQVGPQHSGLLGRLGLRSTDVITAVNGIELNDPGRAIELSRQLQNEREVAVTLRRDGTVKNLTIDTSLLRDL